MAEIDSVAEEFSALQGRACGVFEDLDGPGRFSRDAWRHGEGGGGDSRLFGGGRVFEKLGVNFSHIHGKALPAAAQKAHPELRSAAFSATGVSIVAHPLNPHVPTSHANLRFFTARPAGAEPVWWFGGGCDLTPYYGYEEDCRDWHGALRDVCDKEAGAGAYPRLKKWCDEYFYLPHRGEHRGIGGIFFDNWREGGFAASLSFVRAVGEAYLMAYGRLVRRRGEAAYGERERAFQLYRRGRYVEFNLLHDRGTRFGLESGGRVESILMSLPPLVRWEYGWRPEKGSAEESLSRDFLPPRDWV